MGNPPAVDSNKVKTNELIFSYANWLISCKNKGICEYDFNIINSGSSYIVFESIDYKQ